MVGVGLCIAGMVLSTTSAGADSWLPYSMRRAVAPGGRYYLLAREEKQGGGGTAGHLRFQLCRRGEWVLPLAPTRRDGLKVSAFDRDPGDIVVAEGTVPYLPLEIRVLDGEAGAVLFEQYGGPGFGVSLSFLDGGGRLRWQLPLARILDRVTADMSPRTGGSIWWWSGWWVDEARRRIVVADYARRLREVDLEDGTVSTTGPEVVLSGFDSGQTWEREDALRIGADLLPAGILARVERLAGDPKEPLSIRLRATVAWNRALLAPLFREGVRPDRPSELVTYALGEAMDALGYAGLPILRDALCASGVGVNALQGLEEAGERAVPILAETLLDEARPQQCRLHAAHALRTIRSDRALPALREALLTSDGEIGLVVLGAVLSTIQGPFVENGRVAGILYECLNHGTSQDVGIAEWFGDHPTRLAVRPLLRALERSRDGSSARTAVLKALRACSREDHGDNPKAWVRALGPG